jgi:osmotically-inducible protein OsmY
MIRPIIRPDVEVERESSSEIATNAKNRLTRIQMPKRLKGIEASVDGGTVVLRGQVANESDKRMVERLVMLEPGIDSVRNEVTVTTSPAERIQAKPSR